MPQTVEGVIVSRGQSGQKYVGNSSSAERMAVLERLNKAAGYSAPQTLFPEGTALIGIGEEKLARQRREVADLPTVRDFAPMFIQNEALRVLRDVPANLGGVRMLPDGKIQRTLPDGKPGPAIGYTHTGLSQLVTMHAEILGVPGGFTRSLEFLSPAARAHAFNDLAIRADDKIGKQTTPDRIFRTALDPNGMRYLRAVTSTKHVGMRGGYAAMMAALAKLAPDAKIRCTHSEDRMDIEVIFPMMAREIKVGDVLWGTLGLTISETKDVAAGAWDALMRVLCVNLTRAYYGKATEWTRKHVGAENFLRDLLGRMAEGRARLQPFINAFGDAYSQPFPSAVRTRSEVVERTFKKFEIKALPAESVIQAWDLDGKRGAGDTLAGLANALTRASQPLGIESAEEIERVAGQLIAEGWKALA